MARIRENFAIHVPVRALFDAPTVAGFAEAMLADPNGRDHVLAIAAILRHVEEMSPDEIQALLQESASVSLS